MNSSPSQNGDGSEEMTVENIMNVGLQVPPSKLTRSISSDSLADIPETPVESGGMVPASARLEWTKKRIILALFQSSLYYYVYVCVGFQNGIIGPLITHQQKRANVSPNQIGWILTARGFGLVFATLISGFLYYMIRRYDDQVYKWYQISINKVLVIMLLFTLFLMLAIPFSTNLPLLLVVYFLQGATSGVCEVGCNLAIANVWREKVRPFMQALHFFAAGGSLLFPLIITQIFTFVTDSWAQLLISYVLCGCLSGLVCIPLLISPSPKERRLSPLIEKNKGGPWYYVVRCRFWRLTQRTFIQFLSFSSFIFMLTAVLKGIATGVYSTYGGLIFQYSQRKNLGTDIELAYLTTAFWATFAGGRLIAIAIESMHLFKVNIPFCALLSSCVAGSVIAYIVLLFFHDNIYGIWVGSILQGLFCAPISAASMVLPQTSFRIPVNAASTSMVALGSTVGELLIPTVINVMSYVFAEDSLLVTNFTFILIALVDVICLFFFGKMYMLWKRSKRERWLRVNITTKVNPSDDVKKILDSIKNQGRGNLSSPVNDREVASSDMMYVNKSFRKTYNQHRNKEIEGSERKKEDSKFQLGKLSLPKGSINGRRHSFGGRIGVSSLSDLDVSSLDDGSFGDGLMSSVYEVDSGDEDGEFEESNDDGGVGGTPLTFNESSDVFSSSLSSNF